MAVTLKHRWSLSHNYLAGITADRWWCLLRRHRFAIDPAYWHRAAFITASSWMNSWYQRKEEQLYHDRIAAVKIAQPPVFVLGHWRSGTTHLHYLLAEDRQFAFANTYQVINPFTFLCSEERNVARFAKLVPDKRPMDNMALSFRTPQEDEFAPCLMSLYSPYLGISFARCEEEYGRYLTFRDVALSETEEWKRSFIWFVKKLTLKYRRRLLLKSPPHTARIRLLLELFPDAQFIHLRRNPYRVFQSVRHYFDTAMWYTYLQQPDFGQIELRILKRYQMLHDAYFEERDLIPADNFHELTFEELERDPIGQVQSIYDRLRWPGFNTFEPRLRRYLESVSDYRKNEFAELDPSVRKRVFRAWQRNFDEWRYAEF